MTQSFGSIANYKHNPDEVNNWPCHVLILVDSFFLLSREILHFAVGFLVN